jgi:hypothetical protein
VVCVFARKTSEPLASLVKQIDSKIGENSRLKSFVVITPKKGDNPADDLKRLATTAGIKHVPLTIGESPDGPPNYEVARDADVTVMMWSGHKVKAARGFKGELTEDNIKDILSDVPKVLGK